MLSSSTWPIPSSCPWCGCCWNLPDLAITEAAVGAGITGILFFLTLRRINLIDKDAEHEARREEDHHDDTL
ncbi:MAG: hydrogenase subunit MbhD domain-containing protein [Oscillospiraceae bacterium]